jgi:hypothetical protein
VELSTVVRQGNQASTLPIWDSILKLEAKEGDSFDIRYLLNIKENNATTYTRYQTIKLLLLCQLQHCLLCRLSDASIMSFVDVLIM